MNRRPTYAQIWELREQMRTIPYPAEDNIVPVYSNDPEDRIWMLTTVLWWLLNHYELDPGEPNPRVIERVEAVLKDGPPVAINLAEMRRRFPPDSDA